MTQWHLLKETPVGFDITQDGLRQLFEDSLPKLKQAYPQYNVFNYLQTADMDGSRVLLYGAFDKDDIWL